MTYFLRLALTDTNEFVTFDWYVFIIYFIISWTNSYLELIVASAAPAIEIVSE